MVLERQVRPDIAESWFSTWIGVVPGDNTALFRLLATAENGLANGEANQAPFSGLHPGGGFALLADGSVGFCSHAMNPNTYRAIMTIHGAEVSCDF